MADDDDVPQLSAHTLAALQSFLQEKQQREQYEAQVITADNGLQAPEKLEEDWNLSQFWYDDATADYIAKECVEQSNGGPICCLCTPSIFRALKRMDPQPPNQYYLFEYDTRFRCYGESFVFYDVNRPLELPAELRQKHVLIACDPPFLSEDCFVKVSMSVKLLSASSATKLIFLTGRVMEPLLLRLFKDLRICTFRPKHARHLANEFFCCANYHSERLSKNP